MEDTISNVHDLVDFEDDISLCNFQIGNPQEPNTDLSSRSSVSDEEFSFNLPTTTQFGDDQETPNFLLNYSARSFRKEYKNFNRVVSMETTRQVNSTRGSGGTVWKKHRGGLIGLTRIPATMELSELKKRQNQQPPRPMFRVAAKDGGDGGVLGRRGVIGLYLVH